MDQIDVVSFFAGCGGLDLGFEQAGFRVVWANEVEPHCRATYIRNHPDTKFILEDICNLDPSSIPNCDGFIGGPPCQSWSVGGKQRGLDDKRGELFVKYIKLIEAKKPKFFVIENVKGMLDKKFKEVFEFFIKTLDCAGYNVKWSLLDAIDYRIPQNRERVFIIGFKKDLNINYEFPYPTSIETISLEKAIGDIDELPNIFITGKECSSIGARAKKYTNHDVLASKFGSFYYRGNRRRGWQQPSFTINATAEYAPLHPSSPKMIYYGHENWNFQKDRLNEYRRLSVRECARIQTFPDNFIFEYTNIKDGYRMIGNAVPPRLGYTIAQSILRVLNKDLSLSASSRQRINSLPYSSKNGVSPLVLVGYCKGISHKKLILTNKLYYVRSDGRPGSLFKEDCTETPLFLLLHHKNKAEIYELDRENPDLIDASFLKSLGFITSGKTYICFRIVDTNPKDLRDANGRSPILKYTQNNYSPYITSLDKVLEYNYE